MTYLAFSDEARAFAFEKYLKSSSGRAFAKKRLSTALDRLMSTLNALKSLEMQGSCA